MAKITVNDWQTIQTRKDTRSIRKSISYNRAVDLSVLVELFLLIVGFCLDNIFGSESLPDSVWIILSIIAILIPSSIFLIVWLVRVQKVESLKQVHDVREMITMFDDELCYYVMTASSFFESIIDNKSTAITAPNYTPDTKSLDMTTINSKLQEFYYIEASYYLNKSVNVLCLM